MIPLAKRKHIMWFKQIQIFQLSTRFKHQASEIHQRLEPFAFQSCLPSMPSSMGWVSPLGEEDAPLTRGLNGCFMITLQIEDKILPASVVNQTLKDKIKQIELNEARKVRQKEKLNFKDELVHTLLTRAFTKFTNLSAYIDTRNHWLVLNSISPAKTELFLTMFQKAFGECMEEVEVVKPSALLTHWLKTQEYPQEFSIGKSCVLQDPEQQNRVVRCQQQDLFTSGVQTIFKEGFDVIQMELCWQDRIRFVLADDFSLRSVTLNEEDINEMKETYEDKNERFDADLILMSESYTGMFKDLLKLFIKRHAAAEAPKLAVAV
jgi:recombination associated protein RdgC